MSQISCKWAQCSVHVIHGIPNLSRAWVSTGTYWICWNIPRIPRPTGMTKDHKCAESCIPRTSLGIQSQSVLWQIPSTLNPSFPLTFLGFDPRLTGIVRGPKSSESWIPRLTGSNERSQVFRVPDSHYIPWISQDVLEIPRPTAYGETSQSPGFPRTSLGFPWYDERSQVPRVLDFP